MKAYTEISAEKIFKLIDKVYDIQDKRLSDLREVWDEYVANYNKSFLTKMFRRKPIMDKVPDTYVDFAELPSRIKDVISEHTQSWSYDDRWSYFHKHEELMDLMKLIRMAQESTSGNVLVSNEYIYLFNDE